MSEASKYFVKEVRNELLSRFARNPSYSVRAFARSVGVDQSQLSKILRGTLAPSRSLMLRVGSALSMDTEDILRFRRVTDRRQKKNAQSSIQYSQLEEDTFRVISDWYHFAILELSKIKGFRPQASWVSKRLGISTFEAKEAIGRLVKCKLIKIASDGSWVLHSPGNLWENFETTNIARRNLQKVLLQKGLDAIDTVDFSHRENASLTIAMDQDLMMEVKKEISAFRSRIATLIAKKSKKRDEVYQLCFALFPLTKCKDQKKGKGRKS